MTLTTPEFTSPPSSLQEDQGRLSLPGDLDIYALDWLIFAFQIVSRYMYQLDFMLSTLLNNSPDTPINLIIITDSLKPKKVIAFTKNILCCHCFFLQMIANTIGKFLSEKVILEKFGSIQTDDVATFMKSKEFLSEKLKVLPDLKVEFLDFNSILGKHNASIQEMKKYFGPNNKTVWLPPGDLRYLFLSLIEA